MRLAVDQQKSYAENLVAKLAPILGEDLVRATLDADQSKDAGINAQRQRVVEIRAKLATVDSADARSLSACLLYTSRCV